MRSSLRSPSDSCSPSQITRGTRPQLLLAARQKQPKSPVGTVKNNSHQRVPECWGTEGSCGDDNFVRMVDKATYGFRRFLGLCWPSQIFRRPTCEGRKIKLPYSLGEQLLCPVQMRHLHLERVQRDVHRIGLNPANH
jgi:hypothetical protein